MEFIKGFPYVGKSLYFNFIDKTNNEGNTALIPIQYGQVVKKYIDGEKVLKMQFEIRQVKPLSVQRNTTENTEQLKLVQDFLDWINEQGEKENYPDFGEKCNILNLAVPDGVLIPQLAGATEDGNALYAFPFEITYKERK